jgi:hypothetical protein
LSTGDRVRYLYLAYFSKPKRDRVLFRAIGSRPARKILEIGLGSTQRTLRLIDLAARTSGGAVRYAAIDLFEARAAGPEGCLSLKEAHCLLKATKAQVQLIPGDPAMTLRRSANSLQNMDLVIVNHENPAEWLGEGWFYLPRMLHEGSRVYFDHPAAETPVLVARAEIESRAAGCRPRRAA